MRFSESDELLDHYSDNKKKDKESMKGVRPWLHAAYDAIKTPGGLHKYLNQIDVCSWQKEVEKRSNCLLSLSAVLPHSKW